LDLFLIYTKLKSATSMCKASVIIPAYNAESYIEKTIESVINQSFSDFEIIVVNDGSTDLTEEKVKAAMLRDERIRLISQPNSGGPAKPRNTGVENAKGEYIFIFDADDLMLPNKVADSISTLDKELKADFLFSNFSSIGEEGKILKENYLQEYDSLWRICKEIYSRGDYFLFPYPVFYEPLLTANFIGTSSVVIRASALNKNNRFDEALTNADDYLFWVSFLKGKNAIFIKTPLHLYRILKTGISARSYLKRGPSRIAALTAIKDNNPEPQYTKIISKKIAKEYLSMSFAFKNQKDKKNQRTYAIASLKQNFNIGAIKLYVRSFFG
jgi:glycosyltransferase involved in cell wall biosynthesis